MVLNEFTSFWKWYCYCLSVNKHKFVKMVTSYMHIRDGLINWR